MRFISFKRKQRGSVSIFVRERAQKYGPELSRESIRAGAKAIVLAGPHNSGKSRYLRKMHDNAGAFWREFQRPYSKKTNGNKEFPLSPDRPVSDESRAESTWEPPAPLFLHGTKGVDSWTDGAHLAEWWNAKPDGQETPWRLLKAYQKQDLLPDYLKETRAALLIDDADLLSKRKQEIAKACSLVAFRIVVTCKDENRLPLSLRMNIMGREPQIVDLQSDAAYDVTAVFIWLLIAVCAAAGAPELAMLLFGFKMFGAGNAILNQRAAKQN